MDLTIVLKWNLNLQESVFLVYFSYMQFSFCYAWIGPTCPILQNSIKI